MRSEAADVHDPDLLRDTPGIQPIAKFCCWLLVASALIILAGWQLRVPALKGAMFGTYVAPNTALLLLLAVLSVRLQWYDSRAARLAGLAVGAAVAAFAATMVAEHLTGLQTGLSKLFFAHRLDDWSVRTPPGLVALPTAVGFVFAGVSLVALRRNNRLPLCEIAAAGVAAVGYLAVVGYIFNARDLYGRVMAVPTAILLLLLATILFGSSQRRWLLSLVSSDRAGSLLWRRVGPPLALVIPAIGFARLWALEQGYVSLELGAALFVVVIVFAFTAILLNTAAALNALDAERRAAAASLLRTEKFAATGRLAATVAHEINNPLEAATNLIYLANHSGAIAPDTQRLLEMADRELRRVAHITRQTLGFYRGESTPRLLPLHQAVQDVRELLARKISEASVTVTQSGDDCSAWADPNEIRQVVSNLLSNAIDATASAPVKLVAIEISSNGPHDVVLKIADSGPGIPEADHSRLFEPFFTTKNKIGTGLGLYVTRQLVEKNGGSIHFETHPGRQQLRTIAVVRLPAATDQSQAAAS